MALLRKISCNLRDPMGFRHPVRVMRIYLNIRPVYHLSSRAEEVNGFESVTVGLVWYIANLFSLNVCLFSSSVCLFSSSVYLFSFCLGLFSYSVGLFLWSVVFFVNMSTCADEMDAFEIRHWASLSQVSGGLTALFAEHVLEHFTPGMYLELI